MFPNLIFQIMAVNIFKKIIRLKYNNIAQNNIVKLGILVFLCFLYQLSEIIIRYGEFRLHFNIFIEVSGV